MSLSACLSQITRRGLASVLSAAGVMLLAACGSTSVTSTGPSPIKCLVTLTGPDSPLAPSAGIATITVSTTPECGWTATADANWVARIDPSSGQGSGMLQVAVAANGSAGDRQTDVVVNSARARIQQEAAPCRYALSESSATVDSTGGTHQVTVSTSEGCEWTASSATTWISITDGSAGTGGGVVEFTAQANDSSARTGHLIIAGQSFTVTQIGTPGAGGAAAANCAFTVNPMTLTVPAGSSSGMAIAVSTTASCGWTATSTASWITVTAGASGSGPGTVKFDVAANSGGARNGTLTVAGRTVTVAQASACTYVVNPATVSVAAGGGSGPGITVSTSAACSWVATTGTPWLTITSGSSGSGNGTVHFTASQNTADARAGSLSIAGQTVAVNQASGCVYAVTLTPTSFRDEGGTGLGTVTTAQGCTWTASSDSTWIVVQSGATGSGPGSVSLQIQVNPGANRTGKVTIAGQVFDIKQSNK